MKRMLCTVLALICLALSVAAFAEAADDPVVVRVGDYTYSKSLVEFTMRSLADQNGLFWELLTQEQKELIRDAVIDQVIGIGLIENKLKEKGRHDFTEAEEELIRASAQNQYDQTWQQLYRYMNENGVSVTQQQVSEWLDSMGYTVEMFYLSGLASERQFRMFELYCDDVALTDDEIDAYYLENFVNPDREKYEYDISAYEEEILLTGSESFFTPEGYRLMKWVVVPYPDDVADRARPVNIKATLAETETLSAYNALAEAAATVEDFNDLKPYREAYDEATAALAAATEELVAALSEAMPEAEAVKSKIVKQMSEGMTFDHAVRLYDSEQTYADPSNTGMFFHLDSPNWTEGMYEKMASLTEPGALSDPLVAQEGMFIFYYAGDVPAGIHELTEEERQMVAQNATYNTQLNQLMELMEGWKQDYTITVDLERIDLK